MKLVRDLIPSIIEESGKKPIITFADEDDMPIELEIKLMEEVHEYLSAIDDEDALEELADILEVIMALCKLHGVDIDKVEEIRKAKAKERGAFNERIILLNVE